MLKKQTWHIVILTILLIVLYVAVKKDPVLTKGELFGISTRSWLLFSLLIPILHQVYVLVCWRTQLYHNSILKRFGDKGFLYYKIGFTILIIFRPISILLLAISNTKTLPISSTWAYIVSGILLIPAIYLLYSVKTYFGIDRAFGLDHFYPEKAREMPLVKQGIFKYTSNGMYVFGFLGLWVIAILFQSKAALLAALFSHFYIWVHYYTTELPDMKVIYQGSSK